MNGSESLRGYPYHTCRLLGHAWHEVPSDWSPRYGVPMTLRCERCGMERRDSIGRSNGLVEARYYTAPSGYHFSHDDGDVPSRTDFRLAWLNDAIEKQRALRLAKQKRKQAG